MGSQQHTNSHHKIAHSYSPTIYGLLQPTSLLYYKLVTTLLTLHYCQLHLATSCYYGLHPATSNYPLDTSQTATSFPTPIYSQFPATSLLTRVVWVGGGNNQTL